ncbi:MAG: N-acetylneuraminate synthase [Gammaproteobacteria bacterium]|nr:N-acetylneuraminate synthase [Gammaproteobacteria bacterium]
MGRDKVFIIAEAGVNHNGELAVAKQLIDVAADAGVDAVKFQLYRTEELVVAQVPKADYQIRNAKDKTETQFAMLKKLEFNNEQFSELIQYTKLKGIQFLCSAFDLNSIDRLIQWGLTTFKIPSGEIDNLPYLRKIGKLNQRVILSTGMSSLTEVEQALNILLTSGTQRNNITILHCTTEYPAPINEINLKAMVTIRETCNIAVGYSDHTLGIEAAIAAVALGAMIIEKHFTLDKTMLGPDHQASLIPSELKEMVSCIRNIELALGDGIKVPSQTEIRNRDIARKSIVAKRKIMMGEIFTEDNLAIKRAGKGTSPMMWDAVMGQVAQQNYSQDDLI